MVFEGKPVFEGGEAFISEALPEFANGKVGFGHGMVFRAFRLGRTSAARLARIEQIAQTVAEHVEAEDGERDGKAGQDR
ncbi:L-aminopeptidase/D-esterase-like protein [Rhizobium ruizarguesonis]